MSTKHKLRWLVGLDPAFRWEIFSNPNYDLNASAGNGRGQPANAIAAKDLLKLGLTILCGVHNTLNAYNTKSKERLTDLAEFVPSMERVVRLDKRLALIANGAGMNF